MYFACVGGGGGVVARTLSPKEEEEVPIQAATSPSAADKAGPGGISDGISEPRLGGCRRSSPRGGGGHDFINYLLLFAHPSISNATASARSLIPPPVPPGPAISPALGINARPQV